jgi:hypothetical protein
MRDYLGRDKLEVSEFQVLIVAGFKEFSEDSWVHSSIPVDDRVANGPVTDIFTETALHDDGMGHCIRINVGTKSGDNLSVNVCIQEERLENPPAGEAEKPQSPGIDFTLIVHRYSPEKTKGLARHVATVIFSMCNALGL